MVERVHCVCYYEEYSYDCLDLNEFINKKPPIHTNYHQCIHNPWPQGHFSYCPGDKMSAVPIFLSTLMSLNSIYFVRIKFNLDDSRQT